VTAAAHVYLIMSDPRTAVASLAIGVALFAAAVALLGRPKRRRTPGRHTTTRRDWLELLTRRIPPRWLP
jgi:hypothetical protein